MLGLLTACGSSSGDQPAGEAIDHYLAAVQSGDGSVVAQRRSGSLPSGGGPSVQASTSGALLPGGLSIVSVSSSSAMDQVVVGVQGASGYYELTGLPSAAAQSVLLTLAQTAPSTFSFLVAGGSGGSVGASTSVPVTLTAVGTGDVQVTLTWDVDSDVDLHVTDPAGEEITTGIPRRRPADSSTWTPTPDARWTTSGPRTSPGPPATRPTAGTTCLVDYWDACSQAETHYVVTVNQKGKPPVTFQGSALTGPGDRGEACSPQGQPVCGTSITTFDVP